VKTSHRVQKEPASPSRRGILLLVLALPSVIAVGAAWILKDRPYASDITLRLTVSRFAFDLDKTSLGDELVRSLNVGSIAMSNVDKIEFGARRVLLADSKKYDLQTDSYPEDAWKEIMTKDSRVVLRGGSAPALPLIRIEPKRPERMLQTDPVSVKIPSQVVLEVTDQSNKGPEVVGGTQRGMVNHEPVELKLTIQPREGVFNVATRMGPIQIQLHDLSIPGDSRLASNRPATLVVEFDQKNTKVTITPKSGPLDLVFTPLLSNLEQNMLPGGALQLSHPQFLSSIPNATPHPVPQQNAGSLPYESSILREGQLTNREFPEKTAKIPPRAFLHFNDEATWRLTTLSVLSTGAIQVELQGHPFFIYSTSDLSGSDRVSYQMTWLDYLMESKPTRLFFAIGVWFATTTLAGYRLFKEFRGEAEA